MMFSKTYCPFCKQAKDFLFKKGIQNFAVLELDQFPEGEEIMRALRKKTGQATVPNIFINNEHVGGHSDLLAADKTGDLEAKLVGLKNLSTGT